MLEIVLAVLISLLAGRTLLWHLQNWQLREYRVDRIKAYFSTREGKRNVFNLWFFRGILPRPRFSGRIFLIILITVFLIAVDYFIAKNFAEFCQTGGFFCDILRDFVSLEFFWKILIYERFLWLFVWLAVLVSSIPVNFSKKRLYAKALRIIKSREKSIKIIGITGSYGKSSTREILTHLLMQEFGKNSVLTNPENHNTEVSIARLVLKSREFLRNSKFELNVSGSEKSSNLKVLKKFLVIEIGAYRKGEIKTVCDFLSPEIGIITGINNQHIALFGSQENITKGKFELAESASEKVFFNADNNFLAQIFADKKIQAVPIGISRDSAKIIKSEIDKTIFQLYGKEFILPWGGEFFVDNSLLAIETACELGCKPENLAKNLATLPQLKKALNIEKLKNGGVILRDLYSQNPDGVLAAIKHLAKFRGKLIFVGTPLLELGKDDEKIHQEIFENLAKIKAEVFWLKEEFSALGKKICGKKFHGQNPAKLAKMRKKMGKNDAILFTGRVEV